MAQKTGPQQGQPPRDGLKHGGAGVAPEIPESFEQAGQSAGKRKHAEGERHIHVIGMDDFNLREIEGITSHPDYSHCRFHPLLRYDELGQTDAISFNDLLAKARETLDRSEAPVDAIMTFWDFPAQTMVPLLAKERDLPACDLLDVEKCEHKYWARVLQKESVPEATPDFAAVDPFAADQELPDLEFPFWLKPIKSFSSYLAFKIESEDDFDEALARMRESIDRVATPYNELLEHLTLPDEIARVDGCWCLAEQVISGEQCTVEGYCYEGRVYIHGIIDSVNEKGSSSFARYQYPSHLPQDVQERLRELSTRLIEDLGYMNAAFNIEYFYEPKTGELKILEVNPRISQSHSELFRLVDGLSNEAIPVSLALGRNPDFPHRQGTRKLAAKFYLRAHEDAYVRKAPDEQNIREIESRYDDVATKILAEADSHLSDQELTDSYSYELAQLFIGADSEEELLETYRDAAGKLNFELDETSENLQQLLQERYQPALGNRT